MSHVIPPNQRGTHHIFAKRPAVPLKDDCPNCAILLRGRKNSAQRDHELQAAVSIAPKPKGFGGRTV